MTVDQFLQYIFSGITNGSIYALTALCFTLIFNSTQIINFAQGQMVMLGGMVAVAICGAGLPLWAGVLLAVAVVTVISIVLERVAVRPLAGRGLLVQIVATVAVSFILEWAAMRLWGREAVTLAPFPGGNEPLRVGGATLTWQALWVVGLTVLIVAGLQLFYRKSLFGTAIRACAVNPMAARLQGVSYRGVVIFSFALAGAISAIAGAAITPISFMSYRQGALLGLKGFAAATLGGLGSPVGAVFGGFVLGIVEALSVPLVSAGYKDVIAFVILLLVLFLRPSGLLGRRAVEG